MTFSTLASLGVSLQGGGGSGGGGGTPGGSDTQVQFNDGGSFGGDAGLTFNKTTDVLTLGGSQVINGGTLNGTLLNMSQTWGGTGTYTGIKYDVTDSGPSNAASLLMDLQVGGASQFSVAKGGSLNFGGGVSFSISGTPYVRMTTANFRIVAAAAFEWSSTGSATGAADLFLTRRAAANLRFGAADAAAPVAQTLSVQSVVAGTTNTAGANLTITGSQGTGTGAGGSIIFQVAPAGTTGTAQNALSTALQVNGDGGITGQDGTTANTLALRNGANAQAFRLYNTFTSATNFERANFFWDTNVLKIGTEKGSAGGTARALEFQTDGTTRFEISATSNNLTAGGSGGNILLGAIGNLRTRFVSNPGNSLNMFDFVNDATGTATFAVNGTAPLFRFGGTTSSFPALKRSSASLQVRLADDSAFAAVQGKLTTETAYTAGAPTATGYLVLYDSNGTAYKVAAEAL